MIQVILRDVCQEDLAQLFEHQNDSEANLMAAFPPRPQPLFMEHWQNKILGDPAALKKAIIVDESQLAGNILSWEQCGRQLVGYWLGRQYWGKGIATAALMKFLSMVSIRPLFAYAAKHNVGSIKVLQKCGFKAVGEQKVFSEVHDHEIDELTFMLE